MSSICSPTTRQYIRQLSRAKLVLLLEEHCGCQCYDSESDKVLKDAIICNLRDRTLSPRVVMNVYYEREMT